MSTATTASKTDPARLERQLFVASAWSPGTRDEFDIVKGIDRRVDIVSLSLEGASEAQRASALSVLQEWGIAATVVHSRSMGDIPVLRMDNLHGDIDRLKVARAMFKPESWVSNLVRDASGKDAEALNMGVPPTASDVQVRFVKERLASWGIEADDVQSRSLGGIRVLRVSGDDVSKLRTRIPPLRAPALPRYPFETHILFTGTDGSMLVRTKSDDGVGLLDNPMGPAAVSPKGSVYALEGRIMTHEEWSASPRTAAQHSPTPSRSAS
jgi:hypothetical protein